MRPRISIRGSVRPSVGRSVGPSVGPSVRRSVTPSPFRRFWRALEHHVASIGSCFSWIHVNGSYPALYSLPSSWKKKVLSTNEMRWFHTIRYIHSALAGTKGISPLLPWWSSRDCSHDFVASWRNLWPQRSRGKAICLFRSPTKLNKNHVFINQLNHDSPSESEYEM